MNYSGLRLSVEKKFIGQVPFDSMNNLIKFACSKKSKLLPEDLVDVLLEFKSEFYLTPNIRDFIIHNGKQISLLRDEEGYKLGPFDDEGALIDGKVNGKEKYEYLLPYLAERTINMLALSDAIAEIINREFRVNYGNYNCYLIALEGVCIPSFVKFLGLDN